MNAALISSLGYLRIATCAPRVAIADVAANVEEIKRRAVEVHALSADVAVYPELCITGYTCGDLFRQPTLLQATLKGLEDLRLFSENLHLLMVVGAPLEWRGKLYNTAVVINDGALVAVVPKSFLPNTREYYDQRWFASGRAIRNEHIELNGHLVPFGVDVLVADSTRAHAVIGVEVCEDLWSVEPPSGDLARNGATVIINCSASNDIVGKASYRTSLVQMQSARTYTVYAFASAGPTESTTDVVYGGHCMIAECGEIVAQSGRIVLNGTFVIADVDVDRCIRERLGATSFAQEEPVHQVRRVTTRIPFSAKHDVQRRIDTSPFVPSREVDRAERCREIMSLQAAGLAVRVQRSGARKLVVGLSGGLDSTLALLVCTQACQTLGLPYDTILAVTLPGMGTTDRTLKNAGALARALGVSFESISIENAVLTHFADIGHDPSNTNVVYENTQARERTQILMDLANMHRGIVVGTGDLSEIALGWSTTMPTI